MKGNNIVSKVTRDMFGEQLQWSVWFIGIMVLLHVIGSLFSLRYSFELGNLFAFSYLSIPVYMLVIGIIAGSYFMPFLVKHGVTRKDYFRGTAMAALSLSAALVIIFLLLSVLENGVYTLLNIPITFKTFNQELGSNGIVLDKVVYILNILTYYLLGWLIYLGYYRFKWMIGLGFTALAILFASLHGFIWGDKLIPMLGIELAQGTQIPILTSVLATMVLIGVILGLIRLMTKRVPIKV